MKKQKANINENPTKAKPSTTSNQRLLEMLEGSIPMSPPDLQALFDHLTRDGVPECDHTLRETRAFLKARKIKASSVVEWLQQHGGYCDCEVRLNVMDEFAEDLGKLEQYGASQLPEAGKSGDQTVGSATAPKGMSSNQQPTAAKDKNTAAGNATSAEAQRPEGTKRAHPQIPKRGNVKVMQQAAKQLEWAIARDKSKLRLCRAMIRKAKNAR